MKYTTMLVLLIIVVTVSCKKKEETTHCFACDDYVTTVKGMYKPNYYLDTVHTAIGNLLHTPKAGKGSTMLDYTILHKISYNTNMNSVVQVRFSVDSGVTSFTYDAAALQQRFAYFRQFNGNYHDNDMPIINGTVSGTKNGDTWQVKMKIDLPEEDLVSHATNIDTTATFTLWE